MPFLLFLDSASDPAQLGHYSFLAADPATAVRSKGLLTQQLVEGSWIRVVADPLGHVGALVASHAAAPVAGLPPFQGGAAGYVGYDWGMMLERVPRPRYDDFQVPDVLLALYDWVIAWDHAAGRAWVISTGIPERGTAREQLAARRLTFVQRRLADGRTAGQADGGRDHHRPSAGPPVRQSAPSYAPPPPPGPRARQPASPPPPPPPPTSPASGRISPAMATSTPPRASSSTCTPATSSRRTCRNGSKPPSSARRSSCTAGCATAIRRPSPPTSISATWWWRARPPSASCGCNRAAESRHGRSRGPVPGGSPPSTTRRSRARSWRAKIGRAHV